MMGGLVSIRGCVCLRRDLGPLSPFANSSFRLNVAIEMTNSVESLGLIAGNRSLPLIFARQARNLGIKKLVAVAFEGETDTALTPLVDEIIWLKVGQLSKMIAAFSQRGIKHCV